MNKDLQHFLGTCCASSAWNWSEWEWTLNNATSCCVVLWKTLGYYIKWKILLNYRLAFGTNIDSIWFVIQALNWINSTCQKIGTWWPFSHLLRMSICWLLAFKVFVIFCKIMLCSIIIYHLKQVVEGLNLISRRT